MFLRSTFAVNLLLDRCALSKQVSCVKTLGSSTLSRLFKKSCAEFESTEWITAVVCLKALRVCVLLECGGKTAQLVCFGPDKREFCRQAVRVGLNSVELARSNRCTRANRC